MSRFESTATNVKAAARTLRRSFAGGVYLPGDAEYDGARLGWNRAIDARPAIVAQPAGAQDVRTAVSTARDHGWPLAVQATGHGTVRPSDGGMLVSTSQLAGVDIDRERRGRPGRPRRPVAAGHGGSGSGRAGPAVRAARPRSA